MVAEQADELKSVWAPRDPDTVDHYPEVWRRLRETDPVASCDKWGGVFTAMRYADVVAVEKDYQTFTATKLSIVPASPKLSLPRLPLHKDPPESKRYRKAMNPSFKAHRIRSFEEPLRAAANGLFADAVQTPERVDFLVLIGESFSQGALGLLVGF